MEFWIYWGHSCTFTTHRENRGGKGKRKEGDIFVLTFSVCSLHQHYWEWWWWSWWWAGWLVRGSPSVDTVWCMLESNTKGWCKSILTLFVQSDEFLDWTFTCFTYGRSGTQGWRWWWLVGRSAAGAVERVRAGTYYSLFTSCSYIPVISLRELTMMHSLLIQFVRNKCSPT